MQPGRLHLERSEVLDLSFLENDRYLVCSKSGPLSDHLIHFQMLLVLGGER